MELLESLAGISTITCQVKTLLIELCRIHSCPLPDSFEQLKDSVCSFEEKRESSDSDSDEENIEGNDEPAG